MEVIKGKMPIIKKKLSTSGYVLIALLVVAVITLPVLHMVGVIDLSFIGDAFANIMMWAATDPINGVLLISASFIGGAITFYAIKTYLLGTQVPVTTGTYTPMGQNISNSNQDEMVVSE